MKQVFRTRLAGIATIVLALALGSCAYYDPYYSSYGASYSSYGSGYGYGSSSFSTSFFVSTGSPGWGYDPYCQSYYNYSRRCYYDPYLNGYYPVGYRPPAVVGCPHPGGWRPGRGTCPPPRNVRNVRLPDYKNRVDGYRRSSHGWAKQVRISPNQRHPANARRATRTSNQRYDPTPRAAAQGSASRNTNSKFNPGAARSQSQRSNRSASQTPSRAGLPSSYNRPINQRVTPNRSSSSRNTARKASPQQQAQSRPNQNRQQNSPKVQRSAPRQQNYRAPVRSNNQGGGERSPGDSRRQGMRNLGQG